MMSSGARRSVVGTSALAWAGVKIGTLVLALRGLPLLAQ